MDYWKLALTCVVMAGYVSWIFYARHNSFQIETRGLRVAYFTWLCHTLLVTLTAFSLLARPIWNEGPTNIIYDNRNLCKIWGKTNVGVLLLTHFVLSFFSYQKTRSYLHRKYKSWVSYAFTGMLGLGLCMIVFLLYEIRAGPLTRNGYKVCAKTTEAYKYVFMAYTIHFVSINMVMVSIFWLNPHIVSESFTHLEHQIWVNKRIVPLHFLSTLMFIFGCSMTPMVRRTKWNFFLFQLYNMIDGIGNNIVLHYTLFGSASVGYVDKEEEIMKRIDNMSFHGNNKDDDMTVEVDYVDPFEDEGTLWIDLPGLHPIEVKKSLVTEHDLWEFTITNRKMLKQIRRARKKQFIPSLLGTCWTAQEIFGRIEAMTPELGADESSESHPSVSDSSENRISHVSTDISHAAFDLELSPAFEHPRPRLRPRPRVPPHRGRLVE